MSIRIGCDMDGVVADFDKIWVDRYNHDFNTDIEYKHIQHWDALLTLTHFEDYDQWWDWARSKHEDLFLAAPVLPGAAEAIRRVHNLGHTIAFITAKPRWAAGHPGEWLIKHDIPFDEIHVTNDKTYVRCDLYVDDAEHNILDFYIHTDATVVQYAAWPYVNGGRMFLDPDSDLGYYYATCWDDIVEIVEKQWK